MLFKIYQGDTALFFYSIAELASFCEVTKEEARKAFYTSPRQDLNIFKGLEV
jgi:hypothetical protein